MRYYDNISKGYDGLYAEEQKAKLRIIKKEVDRLLTEDRSLLDVGCGTGVSSDFGCFVIGLDPSIRLLRINGNKNKVNGNAEFLPFKGNSFDVVISVTSLHNFRDIKKGVEEIKRVGRDKFIFSILKKTEKFELIKNLIYSNFIVYRRIEEEKDIIFFSYKKNIYP